MGRLMERSALLRLGLKFCLLVIIGVSGMTAIFYYFTQKSLGEVYGEAFFTMYKVKMTLFPIIFASGQSLFILCAVTLAIAIIALFYSHKIAGPIYRLEKDLRSIGAGDLTIQTYFRTKDQIKQLAEDINELTRSLNHRVRAIGEGVSGLKGHEDRLRLLVEEGEPFRGEGLGEAIEGLKQGAERLRRALGDVKTS